MNDTALLEKFYVFLEDYMEFYNEFLTLELDKYQIISKNKFHKLDDIIVKEQVFLLKSRGLEKKKDYYLENFGSKNLTLKELINGMVQQEYKDKYHKLHEQLSKILYDLKEANRLCNYLIELNLHKIENHIKKSERPSETAKIYSPSPQKTKRTLTGISKKV